MTVNNKMIKTEYYHNRLSKTFFLVIQSPDAEMKKIKQNKFKRFKLVFV